MRASDASAKALIFSSFQATIEQLQQALPGWGYAFRFINGEGGVDTGTCMVILAQLCWPYIRLGHSCNLINSQAVVALLVVVLLLPRGQTASSAHRLVCSCSGACVGR
jgi:hypothetical protein